MFRSMCFIIEQITMCMMMMCMNDGSSPGVTDV